jgi:hypothetical protein
MTRTPDERTSVAEYEVENYIRYIPEASVITDAQCMLTENDNWNWRTTHGVPLENMKVQRLAYQAMSPTTWVNEREPWRELEVVPEDTIVMATSELSHKLLNPMAPMFEPKGGAHGGDKLEPPRRLVATVTRDHNGPTLSGTVEGVTVRFLVDSGAEGTVINQKCLERLPRAIQEKFAASTGSVYAADGRKMESKGPVLCQLEIAGKRVLDTVYVGEIEDEALLGWETQLAFGVQYTVAGIDLTKSGSVRRVINPTVRRVQVTEDCTIPARSEVIIPGKAEGTALEDNVLVGPIYEGCEATVAVARTLTNGNSATYPVQVLNPSDEPLVLNKGDVIAEAEEVGEITSTTIVKENEGDQLPYHLIELYTRAVEEGELMPEVKDKLKKTSH